MSVAFNSCKSLKAGFILLSAGLGLGPTLDFVIAVNPRYVKGYSIFNV